MPPLNVASPVNVDVDCAANTPLKVPVVASNEVITVAPAGDIDHLVETVGLPTVPVVVFAVIVPFGSNAN